MKYKKSLFVIDSILLLVSFSLPFIAGSFSNGYKIEEIAQYSSDVVNTSTYHKDYLAITVGGNDESGPVLDPYSEFHNLYGTFRQEQASFGSGINFYDAAKGKKTHDIFIKDYNDITISSNLSLFYLGPVGSIDYNGHYKHYIYPFELMFEDSKNYDVSKYLAYISESQADKLLESMGERKNENNKYVPEQYKLLFRKKINMYLDGEIFEYVINNVYFENNYYFAAMKEVFSEFILTSYFSPNKNELISERKNIYFMNEYPYQNQYYMDYINKAYPSKLFNVSINKTNIIKDINEQKILDFYYSDLDNNSTIYIVLVIVYYALLVLSLASLIVFGYSFSIASSTVLGFCAFAPYIFFFFLFKVTRSTVYFTKVAGLNFFIGFIILFMVCVAWYFIHKYVLERRKQ